MDFTLSDEQRALQDSVQRYVSRQYAFESRRAIERTAAGWSPQVWQDLADLGVLGINVPQEHGGLGYGPIETLLVMNLFGSCLLLEPYAASAVVATAVLRDSASTHLQASWLPRLVRGEAVATLAHFEPTSRFDARQVRSRATLANGGYVLQGQKALVEHAAADILLVSARIAGADDAQEGVSLFVVPRDAPGLSLRSCRTLDGRSAADIALESVEVPASARVGMDGGALAVIERSLGFGTAALCAEAVGAMQALVDATVAHLKTRQQFGRPIGSFQALAHRAADMLLELEQARSMSFLAAVRSMGADDRERQRALSAAKVITNRAARFIGQQAVQLHGGMGMTDELQVGHWFKRLAAIEMTLGDTDTHLQRFAALGTFPASVRAT
ncbi:MAG: acyl-CoA dehydrogenase [Gammaproteobacteria bacterium]|nr:acyl-CoA dehydrogenase [Gammaproteobacteria bacterium]